MRLPITPENTLLRDLRTQLRQNHPAGRLLVAVDALPGVPTRPFADDFAAILGEDDSAVFRASAEDFLLPRAERGDGERTPAGFDEELFRRVLVDPFRNGRQTSATTGFQLKGWDARRNQPFEARWVTAPDDAIVVVDGAYLNTRRLRGIWHFSVWLELPEPTFADRPGRSADAPYTPAEVAYLADQPAENASAIVDVSDPRRPAQVFRDSC